MERASRLFDKVIVAVAAINVGVGVIRARALLAFPQAHGPINPSRVLAALDKRSLKFGCSGRPTRPPKVAELVQLLCCRKACVNTLRDDVELRIAAGGVLASRRGCIE